MRAYPIRVLTAITLAGTTLLTGCGGETVAPRTVASAPPVDTPGRDSYPTATATVEPAPLPDPVDAGQWTQTNTPAASPQPPQSSASPAEEQITGPQIDLLQRANDVVVNLINAGRRPTVRAVTQALQKAGLDAIVITDPSSADAIKVATSAPDGALLAVFANGQFLNFTIATGNTSAD